jgi:hypothetical protein
VVVSIFFKWNAEGVTVEIPNLLLVINFKLVKYLRGQEPVVQEAVLLAVNTQDAVSKQKVQSCLRALVAYASVQEAQSVS